MEYAKYHTERNGKLEICTKEFAENSSCYFFLSNIQGENDVLKVGERSLKTRDSKNFHLTFSDGIIRKFYLKNDEDVLLLMKIVREKWTLADYELFEVKKELERIKIELSQEKKHKDKIINDLQLASEGRDYLNKKVNEKDEIFLQIFDLNEKGGPGSRKKVHTLIEGTINVEQIRDIVTGQYDEQE